jgi:hypothetical protein
MKTPLRWVCPVCVFLSDDSMSSSEFSAGLCRDMLLPAALIPVIAASIDEQLARIRSVRLLPGRCLCVNDGCTP